MTEQLKEVCFCITGWHFPESFYKDMATCTNADIYVISHKTRQEVPNFIRQTEWRDRVFFEPNYGYDWGCYQQFLDKGIFPKYQIVIFLHDDLVIRDFGFIEKIKEHFASGIAVVGNGRNERFTDFRRRWPWAYAHVRGVLPPTNFQHECVRGSFFAVKSEALEKIQSFEVFWDRFHIGVDMGNFSQIASCAKIKQFFGDSSFAYLGDQPLKSEFIHELVRGNDIDSNAKKSATVGVVSTFRRSYSRLQLRYLFGLYRRIGSFCVNRRLSSSQSSLGTCWLIGKLANLPRGRVEAD